MKRVEIIDDDFAKQHGHVVAIIGDAFDKPQTGEVEAGFAICDGERAHARCSAGE